MIIRASRKHATKNPGPKTGCRIGVYPPNSQLDGGYTVLYHIDSNNKLIYFHAHSSPDYAKGKSELPWELLNTGTVFTLTQE